MDNIRTGDASFFNGFTNGFIANGDAFFVDEIEFTTPSLFREPAWSVGAAVTLPDPSHSAGAYTLPCDNFSQWK